jgi:hypothetical protein
MQLKLYFLPSKEIATRVTEIFDFVWPTATAIWNLRWQVQGLVGVRPSITEAELRGRFVDGSGIRGANLKRSCIDTTWEVQQEQFAKFLLFEFCALYETWCEIISTHLALAKNTSKHLQFPSSTDKSRHAKSIEKFFSQTENHQSPIFSNSIQSTLASNKKYSPNHIQELLACYRYFKELRNCLIHGSSGALDKLITQEQIYSKLSAAELGLTQRPEYIALSSSTTPTLSLRGVVGFGEVVLRLVCTLDIHLAGTSYAESEFKSRWKVANGATAIPVSTPDANKRKIRIGVLTKKLGLPAPHITQDFADWLKAEKLIFF